MKPVLRRQTILLSLVALVGWVLTYFPSPVKASGELQAQKTIVGRVLDTHGEPIADVEVSLQDADQGQTLVTARSQPDGRFTLVVPEQFPEHVQVVIERPHFKSAIMEVDAGQINRMAIGETYTLAPIELVRLVNSGFWVATFVFVIVLVLIASGRLHTTLSALVGAAILFAFSYLGPLIDPDLYIFDFHGSIQYIDWNVIFLVMGMMMVIAIVEHTGIFQWMAFFAYRVSGGRMFLLLPVLMLLTGIASAFLDNVTTMLLMTPMTVQIAIALGISPLALLLPEVMASNVIGVSTLVGTPTNILIGSYGDISFNSFLANLTPGVLMAFVGLVIYSTVIYRKDLSKARKPTPVLMEKLAERGQISQPENLKKTGIVGLGMLVLFVFGERVDMAPAVTAIMGATALLVWIKPDIEAMIEAVDWTTLVFFMSLFIVVGGIQEVGLISLIADGIGSLVGENLTLAMLAIIWASALLSMVIANIPFTAAMLPVIGYLSATIPGTEGKVLFFCLSVGSAMGGNGTLIGASANMVTAGIADAAGYKISYSYFLRKGFPAVLITVGLATIWLFIRF